MSLSTATPLSEDWAMPGAPKLSEPCEATFQASAPRISSPVIRCIDEAKVTPEKSATYNVVKTNNAIRHSKYYIDEQMAIFLVDNHLYKVHRHFLRRESLKFDDMFDQLPPEQCGQTDENPIILPQVTQGEFEALLEYFYAGLFFKPAESSLRTLQEYIDLLSIATCYECSDARKKAIEGIESLRPTPIKRIVLAEKFDIPSWLEPAYIEICKREKPLELYEGEQLGLQKVILIARAREEVKTQSPPPTPVIVPNPSFWGLKNGIPNEPPRPRSRSRSWSRVPSRRTPSPQSFGKRSRPASPTVFPVPPYPPIPVPGPDPADLRVSQIVKKIFFPPPPPPPVLPPRLYSPGPNRPLSFRTSSPVHMDKCKSPYPAEYTTPEKLASRPNSPSPSVPPIGRPPVHMDECKSPDPVKFETPKKAFCSIWSIPSMPSIGSHPVHMDECKSPDPVKFATPETSSRSNSPIPSMPPIGRPPMHMDECKNPYPMEFATPIPTYVPPTGRPKATKGGKRK